MKQPAYGNWASGFSFSSPGVNMPIHVTLAVTGGTKVTGSYTYSDGTSTIGGTIAEMIMHIIDALGAITGVKINFDWQEGAASGKGIWTSSKENTLQGTWGNGSSDNNGGSWDISK